MSTKLFTFIIFTISTANYCQELQYGRQIYRFSEKEKNELGFCRKFWGKDLFDCMEKMKSIDSEKYKLNLLLLDDGQRLTYFEQKLKNSNDYKDLYTIHKNNVEWNALWNTISQEEKRHFFIKESGLQASSKDNLLIIIKEKEREEREKFDTNTSLLVAGTAIIGFLVFTPAGPALLAASIKLGAGLSATKGATAATIAVTV